MSSSGETILLVEDEEALGEGLKFNFEAEGYRVHWFQDGLEAMRRIESGDIEQTVIVLDLMLPGLNGFEILSRTRVLAGYVPILVLSAKSGEADKVRALELGADDYVTKPFSLAELFLRVRGMARRAGWQKTRELPQRAAAGVAFFSADRLLIERSDGSSFRLSPLEGLLVQTFLDNENRILSRVELLEKVWNQDRAVQTRTVDVFISKLRKYLEQDPAAPRYILSIRGVGYGYITDEKLRKDLLSRGGC
jgi:DNA-binding response OmpR family regulator